jgi:hypothetical protein
MFALGAINSDDSAIRYISNTKTTQKLFQYLYMNISLSFSSFFFLLNLTNLDSIPLFRQRDLEAGEGIATFCMEMYRQTASKLSPEYVEVDLEKQQLTLPPGDARAYIMRPGKKFSLFCYFRSSQQNNLKFVDSELCMTST